ncbi:MAG: MerR family transcriptional regulator [Anaerolineae bacterium]|nr:MerR family transcriptional regulator [Anaerolineae bacterium]
MYTATQVSQLFNVSRETARRWAQEFKLYLSPTANPEKERQRAFTDSDMEVFALISEMKTQGRLFEDIRAALGAGQRGHAPANASALVQADIPRTSALQIRISSLETELTRSIDSNKHLEGRLDELTRQLEATKKELREAYKQIGRLEGE